MPTENGVFREPTNEDRANWAAKALETFARQTSQLKDGDELPPIDADGPNDWWDEVIGDLVCDLAHLADQLGIEWSEVVINAQDAHDQEVEEVSG